MVEWSHNVNHSWLRTRTTRKFHEDNGPKSKNSNKDLSYEGFEECLLAYTSSAFVAVHVHLPTSYRF